MYATETGLQFLDRLTSRPTLDRLNTTLFPDGLKPKELVEVSGDVNCGKTLLMSEFVVKCILPKTWNNILINGLESSVILINTDHHFQIIKLTELLEQYLNNCKVNVINNHLTEGFSSLVKENIIKYALNNLILLNVYDSLQLKMTACSLKQLIAENRKINLVLLDSVCCNYWQDVQSNRMGNVKKMNWYVSNVLQVIHKNIIDFSVCFIYSRPSYFKSVSKYDEATSSEPGLNRVTRRIHLKPFNISDSKMSFCCTVTTSSNKLVKFYTIGILGFMWVGEKEPS